MARNNSMPLPEPLRSGNNNGVPDSGSVPAEYGDGNFHKTVLSLSGTLPPIAGGADLALGIKIYDFPPGRHVIQAAYMNVALQQTEGNVTADTPEVGVGTVLASGANATLSGTQENLVTGVAAADVDGSYTVAAGATPVIVDGGAVYLNVADGWAASGDAAALVSGEVTLIWTALS